MARTVNPRGKGAASLHIAAVQRIVGKRHSPLRVPLTTVRFVLDKALSEAGPMLESRDDPRTREQGRRP